MKKIIDNIIDNKIDNKDNKDQKQRMMELQQDRQYRIRVAIIVLLDIITILCSYAFGLWARFDFHISKIPPAFFYNTVRFVSVIVVVHIVTYYFMRLYHSIWVYVSVNEMIQIVKSYLIIGICALLIALYVPGMRMPLSAILMGYLLSGMWCIIIRYGYRVIRFISHDRASSRAHDNVMIVGAGQSALEVIKDARDSNHVDFNIRCLVDDNPIKKGRYLEGIKIEGNRYDIPALVKKHNINRIVLAMPAASSQDRKAILDICKDTNCKVQTLPGIYQLVNEEIKISKIRDVSIEDLLGREPIRPDMQEVYEFINGKVVLVTGGGGSIGSELCRQIANHHPKRLIIFDIYENNAYDIQLELKEKHPELDFVTLIGSVRDSRKINDVFETYHPDIVYHAAAHKHVPLMEDSPCEAIKNNVVGTYKTAYAAMIHGCQRFVLISTDKAVNPTNVMGASKRLCEMIIQSFDAKIKAGKAHEIKPMYTHAGKMPMATDDVHTEFVAVRFGNVLGSNGSVIPIFKKQIAEGGPVTVTHPDIIRYFMTIPEAVRLVMLAGTYAKGGEIFVLDMGSPVKIDDLARNLIKMSGLKPDVDIKIEYTGLRPGEKLYEEKLMAEEGLKTTDNNLIHIGCPIPFDTDEFLIQLRALMDKAYTNKPDIIEDIQHIVTTYHPVDREI